MCVTNYPRALREPRLLGISGRHWLDWLNQRAGVVLYAVDVRLPTSGGTIIAYL
jgi:hypothetical protein